MNIASYIVEANKELKMPVDPIDIKILLDVCTQFREGASGNKDIAQCIYHVADRISSIDCNQIRDRLNSLADTLSEAEYLFDPDSIHGELLKVVGEIEQLISQVQNNGKVG